MYNYVPYFICWMIFGHVINIYRVLCVCVCVVCDLEIVKFDLTLILYSMKVLELQTAIIMRLDVKIKDQG